MTDQKNKTANQEHQLDRTRSKSEDNTSGETLLEEHSITQNKTIIKSKAQLNQDHKAQQAEKHAQQAKNPQNRMPSMDENTRLQDMQDDQALRQSPPINRAFSAGKNMSAEFAQGLVALPKKMITAYQSLNQESSGNSIFKQFALVILTCIIFYVWTVVRSPLLFMDSKASIEARVLMVDIIELLHKGEQKKANILIKKAAEVEKDEKLAKKLHSIAP